MKLLVFLYSLKVGVGYPLPALHLALGQRIHPTDLVLSKPLAFKDQFGFRQGIWRIYRNIRALQLDTIKN